MIAIQPGGIENIFKKYNYLLLQRDLPNVKQICLHEFGLLATNFKSFLFSNPNVVCTQSEIFVKLVELIVNFGKVKTFEGCEDRDFDAQDFPYVAENAKLCFQYLDYLLAEYEYDNLDTTSKRKFLYHALVLCATHNQKYLWSSENSVALCDAFLITLLMRTKHESLSALLTDEIFHPTIFKGILRGMRPLLMKDTWMKNPSSCHIFHWLLCNVKHPHLVEDYLPEILPPPFMFTSYYSIPQQVIGIKCFDHILDNIPPSLIKADGIEEAIFDILKKYMYLKEKAIIEVLYECMLKLPMMDQQKVNQMQWVSYDVVVQQLLDNINMESDPKLRYLFLQQLHLFLKDKQIFKHLKKTLNVLYNNLSDHSVDEENCRSVSLEILKEILRLSWPRMKFHCKSIMLAVMKVMCDIQNFTDYVEETPTLNLCIECMYILRNICPLNFKRIATIYLKGEESLPGTRLLTQLLEASLEDD